MKLDEKTRHEVFGRLRDHLGEKAAVVLMSAIPPFAWSTVATKSDLKALEERINTRFDAIDQKFNSLRHEMNAIFERGIRRALVAQTFTVFGGVVGLWFLAERFAGRG